MIALMLTTRITQELDSTHVNDSDHTRTTSAYIARVVGALAQHAAVAVTSKAELAFLGTVDAQTWRCVAAAADVTAAGVALEAVRAAHQALRLVGTAAVVGGGGRTATRITASSVL